MIGNRIQKLRQQKRLSLTELSHRSGVAKSYLSSIERNLQRNPSIEILQKLAPELGVDIHSLVSEEYSPEFLSKEWIELVQEVKASGVSIEAIRGYLKSNK